MRATQVTTAGFNRSAPISSATPRLRVTFLSFSRGDAENTEWGTIQNPTGWPAFAGHDTNIVGA